MTALVWAMLTARRGVTLTIALIAAVAVAAGSAGPIYLAAAASAARATELSAAPPRDRAISQTWAVDHGSMPVSMRRSERREPPRLAGFDAVAGFQVTGAVTAPRPAPAWLVHRTGVCDQVVIRAGRCVSGGWEVMVTRSTAETLGARVGHAISFQPDLSGTFGDQTTPGATRLTIVGLYEVRDPAAGYWADRQYVSGGDAGRNEVLFVTAETIAWMSYGVAQEAVDLVPRAETFADPDRLRAMIDTVATDGLTGEAEVTTGIPGLLDRIGAGERALTEGVTVAVVPLVLLCWLVLYLAVSNSAFRRRAEAGLAGLRGVPAGTRWWLGVAEYLVPMLIGAPLGLLGGWLAVAGLAGWLLPDAPAVAVTPLALAFAVAAVLGAAAVGMLAQWRATAVPVATLLRRVPARRGGSRFGAAELVAVTLAAAATYQVATGGARAGGVALLAPMLIALAVGLLCARVVALVAVRAARRGLRRGSLARALSAVLVARQPGQARLLGMFVVLFALLGFAVTAADVAAQARAARVTAELGAGRVVDVHAVAPRRLLAAVRAADPAGRYAMAVTQLPGDGPPTLALDSTRLGRVAAWPATYGMPAGRAAALLRPARPDPVRVAGDGLALRIEAAGRQVDGVRLTVRLQPAGDGGVVERRVEVRPGAATYRIDTPGCRDGGCRLLALDLSGADHNFYDVALTLRSVRQTGPDAPVLDGAHLADRGRWRTTGGGTTSTATTTVTPVTGGVRFAYSGNIGPQAALYPLSTPSPVPLLTGPGQRLELPVSGTATPYERAGQVAVVVGTGATGALVDLEYADLAGYLPGLGRQPQVWLTADAPASVLDRLRGEGLTLVADRSLDSEREHHERRGPALALRFYLVIAVAAVLLGLGGVAVVASTERSALAAQLRALRWQGVPPGITWRVGFGSHAVLTVLSALVGLAAAGLAWWLAHGTIPLFADGGGQFYAPDWPRPAVVAAASLAALLVLTAAGAAAALGLRRAVERSER